MAPIGTERQAIVEHLQDRAAELPDKPAIIAGGRQRSYSDVLAGAHEVAGWLTANGHRPGQPVMFSVESASTRFPSFYFGIHLCNGVAVPVSTRASEQDLARLGEFLGPGTAITGERYAELAERVDGASASPDGYPATDVPSADDICEIIFTTGTTGRPKGVALTHNNTSASAAMIREFVGNEADDIEVVTIPLTHSFGIGRLRASILAGGTVVLVPGLTFPQLVINALRDHRATGLSAVPTGMEILLRGYSDTLKEFADRIRYIEMGSAPMRRESKETLCHILPSTRICMHYGMTEASRSTFLEFHEDFDHLDTVGRPSPGVEIAIQGASDSAPTSEHSGAIMIRAATVMSGYWNAPELTDRVLHEDGWLVTSDEGFIDSQGYLHLLGRLDDVINTGAEKIRAEQLEDIVRRFPGVDDCACTGIPDPKGLLGELPLICIEVTDPDIDTSALLRFVSTETRGKVQDATIEIVESLPRTGSGKMLRKRLPELLS